MASFTTETRGSSHRTVQCTPCGVAFSPHIGNLTSYNCNFSEGSSHYRWFLQFGKTSFH